MTTFESFREVTGWKRPGHDHGCAPVQVVPGVWTAHYHDIDSIEKLKAATGGAPITLVVNSALCQCDARDGFFGPGVRVMEIALEDDPDERKAFDGGKPNCQSACGAADVEPVKRCAGDAKAHFEAVNRAIDAALAAGGHVLVHCKASISRSAAYVLAYLMRSRGLTLLEAARLMKASWGATWPCDRFSFQLIEYEAELRAPYRLSRAQLAGVVGAAAAFGAVAARALRRK